MPMTPLAAHDHAVPAGAATPGPGRSDAPGEGGWTQADPFLSVVVPLYDEEDNVLPLVAQVEAALASAPWPWQLILVDDGSGDRTSERIREAAAADPQRIAGMLLRRRFGQTAAMQAGIDAARGGVIATMDGDLQNNPRDIVRMVRRLLDEDLDLVVGWRRRRRDGLLLRRLPSLLANRLIVACTGVALHDYGCSLKVYRAAVLREVRLYGEMHRFTPVWMATLTAPQRIREEEVSHFERVHGRSKYGLSRTPKVLVDLLTMVFFMRVRARPGHFFGRIGLACSLSGLLVLGWLSWLKLGQGETIAGRPMLLLGILLIVTGVQFLCTGIVTEVLARTWFEASATPSYLVRETVGPAIRVRDGPAPPGRQAAQRLAGRRANE
jgi:glycosyltransferase involved in cell wall biosynthesis